VCFRARKFQVRRLLTKSDWNCHRHRQRVVTTAILQIFTTASPHVLQQAIEQYLRDEIWDIEQQVAADRSSPDA
jgi:hypothetical protein